MAWVDEETKQRFASLARREGLSESALLRRTIVLMLQSTRVDEGIALDSPKRIPRGSRLTIRLSPDDKLLLRERAATRAMAGATYVSVLVRSHLRRLAPLPKEELLALKRSVAELGAIGRNLNQLARAANQTSKAAGLRIEDLRAILRVCEGLRDHVKGLLKRNVESWDIGYVKDEIESP